ncbi:MAG: hypothetical protein JSR77_15480 [Planctomycetes bacterium]|nr:hypothetical protein [Planctomycetota bacterium]
MQRGKRFLKVDQPRIDLISMLSAIVAAAAWTAVAPAQTFVGFVISPLPNRSHDQSYVSGIDDLGRVVGGSFSSTNTTVAIGIGATIPTGVPTSAGTLADCFPYGGSGLYAMSPSGIAAGATSSVCNGFAKATTAQFSSLTSRTVYNPLPGGGDCQALDVNNAAVAVGWSNTTTGCNGALCVQTTARPMRFSPSGMVQLSMGAFPVALANGINAAGVICGQGFVSGALSFDRVSPLLWTTPQSAPTVLPTLGGAFGVASKITDGERIVGWSQTASGDRHATQWVARLPIDLGTLPGHAWSIATDADDAQGAVGSSALNSTAVTTGVLFSGGQVLQLSPRVVNGAGWDVRSASAINRRGWIAANGLVNGQSRGMVLVPCRETLTASSPDSSPCVGGSFQSQVSSLVAATAYHWRRNGQWLTDDGRITGAATATLTITGVTRDDTGMYECVVSTICGDVPSPAISMRPCACLVCPADFNEDGGIDGADASDFFAAWGSGNCDADVNADGGVDGQDVTVFFHAWEAGGC